MKATGLSTVISEGNSDDSSIFHISRRHPQREEEERAPNGPRRALQSSDIPKNKWKPHTARQRRRLEAVFSASQYPGEEERRRLAEELGMNPSQVKYWFQNHRIRVKAQEDRERSAKLRRENTKLTEENVRLKATVDGALCDTCRGSGKLKHPSPEVQRLRLENALIKQQVETISAVISRHQIGQRAKRQPPSIEYQFLSPRPSRSPVGMAAAAAGESDGGDQMSLQGEVKAPQQKKATELNNKE